MNPLTEAAYFLQTSKRRKDQHFLVNESIIEQEVAAANLSKGDIVLEIGGGLGFLTRELVKRCRTITIEKDIRLIGALQRTGAEVIHGDALKLEFPPFTKFVSNIPYSISMPLTLKLLRSDFELGAIIAQKEFAKKLVAKPGDDAYGRLSVIAQYYSSAEVIGKVRKSDFEPHPKVESRIVRFTKRHKENRGFEQFATSLFRHRRKKIAGTSNRPEELAVGDFIKLYEARK